MESPMTNPFVRVAAALALAASTGCADFYFSYVEDASLPIVVQDVGAECETDDLVDTDVARVHVQQDGDTCVITADVLVRAIEYADLEESLDTIDLQGPGTYWRAGGMCWREATEGDEEQPYEKCDYGPHVAASWRLVGETEWSPDPEFPAKARAELALEYYPEPVPTLDDASGADAALVFATTGQSFPGGQVTFDHDAFFGPFRDAVGQDDPADLYSVARAEVFVPMADIAEFTEHELQIEFAYQMYVQGAVEQESLWELFFGSLFGAD
jgi:hypothetical protein